jgi:hypothetical protein
VKAGVSTESASVEVRVPVVLRVTSSSTAPELVPVIIGASSVPSTVMVTVWVTDSPSVVVAVTVNVSLTESVPDRDCAAALSSV